MTEKRTTLTHTPSRHHTSANTLKRRYSSQEEEEEEESIGTLSRSSTFTSDIQTDNSNARWTTAHWKKLEDWYVRKDRDYRKAANSFYYFESLINIELPNEEDTNDGAPITKELWTLDHILWRSQCLDTSVKFHQGLLPSERKKEKKRKLSKDSSTTSNTSSTSTCNTDSSTSSFKIPLTPATRTSSRMSSSRLTTPSKKRSVSMSPKNVTTPVRRIPSYTSSVSFN